MSVVVIVLPKLEDAKKIRKILMGHGFPQRNRAEHVAGLLFRRSGNMSREW